MNIDVVVIIGHTDSTETPDLSIARADFVKGILGGIGLEKNRIYTEGKGGKQPVANNTSEFGQAKNRRVEIEVVGSR
jgi:OOP family OmpA-OmpF porin